MKITHKTCELGIILETVKPLMLFSKYSHFLPFGYKVRSCPISLGAGGAMLQPYYELWMKLGACQFQARALCGWGAGSRATFLSRTSPSDLQDDNYSTSQGPTRSKAHLLTCCEHMMWERNKLKMCKPGRFRKQITHQKVCAEHIQTSWKDFSFGGLLFGFSSSFLFSFPHYLSFFA